MWEFVTAGMHAHYSRAVAVSDDTVLVSASTGPRGRRSALYRKPLDGGTRFERCHDCRGSIATSTPRASRPPDPSSSSVPRTAACSGRSTAARTGSSSPSECLPSAASASAEALPGYGPDLVAAQGAANGRRAFRALMSPTLGATAKGVHSLPSRRVLVRPLASMRGRRQDRR